MCTTFQYKDTPGTPEGAETKRQEETIKDRERILELYESMWSFLTSSISAELYTNITHFILELIQNADDNTYP